jgi:hypothetical protein
MGEHAPPRAYRRVGKKNPRMREARGHAAHKHRPYVIVSLRLPDLLKQSLDRAIINYTSRGSKKRRDVHTGVFEINGQATDDLSHLFVTKRRRASRWGRACMAVIRSPEDVW